MWYVDMKRWKQLICGLLVLILTLNCSTVVLASPENISSPSYVLMEPTTGTVICEKNSDERRSPASITKIMTLLLIFEALEKGQIKLEDEVTTSAHAKSMGGSQVFLEEGEVQTVDTMIKCIAVASGNDASVAMAEKIGGSEAAFVEMMNAKAKDLGLENTHFEDCCGLTNSDNHYTSAKDIGILSAILITKYPQIFEYTKIWMEDITHTTAKGSTTFTLSSTNKLLKQYEYTTGLKTGSTDKAKYCVSATAYKDNMHLIAVVMAAPDYKVRFSDAKALLEYGFSKCSLYTDENKEKINPIPIEKAVVERTEIGYKSPFTYLDIQGNDIAKISKKITLLEDVKAPVKAGDKAGEVTYYLNDKAIGSVDLVFLNDVDAATWFDYFKKAWKSMLL